MSKIKYYHRDVKECSTKVLQVTGSVLDYVDVDNCNILAKGGMAGYFRKILDSNGIDCYSTVNYRNEVSFEVLNPYMVVADRYPNGKISCLEIYKISYK